MVGHWTGAHGFGGAATIASRTSAGAGTLSSESRPFAGLGLQRGRYRSAESGLGARYGRGEERRAALLLQRPAMVVAGRGRFSSATCALSWRSHHQSHRASVQFLRPPPTTLFLISP